MKTSFYFLLWIAVYPLLGLLNNSFVNENSFVVAFVVVIGVSWLLRRLMPRTLIYESAAQRLPLLEDIYQDKTEVFAQQVWRDAIIETVTAIYLIVSTFAVGYFAMSGSGESWIAVAIFALIAYGAMVRSASLFKARNEIESNPTQEECAAVAHELYQVDYAAYAEQRSQTSYEDMLPERPRMFKLFAVVSLVVACVVALVGLWFVVEAVMAFTLGAGTGVLAYAGIYILYGSLAVYYGVKDTFSCVRLLKK